LCSQRRAKKSNIFYYLKGASYNKREEKYILLRHFTTAKQNETHCNVFISKVAFFADIQNVLSFDTKICKKKPKAICV